MPITKAPAIAIAETLSVLRNPSKELVPVLGDEGPEVVGAKASGAGEAAARPPPRAPLRADRLHARRHPAPRTRTCCSAAGCSSRTSSRTAAAMFAFRIGKNWSFLRIRSRRESTHAFSCVLPCLMPMPNGASRNVVVRQLRVAVGGRDRQQDGVVVHDRVGTALVERQHRVRERVGDDDLGALEAVLHPAVVDRAARRRHLLARDVRELLHRRRRSSRAAGPSPCSTRARSRCACRGRRCR